MINTPECTTEGLYFIQSSRENLQCAVYGLLALQRLCTVESDAIDRAALFGLLGPIVNQIEYATNLLEAHVDAVEAVDSEEFAARNEKIEAALNEKVAMK